jgi:hypothetical protein
MKTYLKLATLAMVLIAPAGAYAADPMAGPMGNHQEAQQESQQEPQRIPDPVEFFDKRTGKPKVWYWRTESGYEFYDAPGFHPRTGGVLTSITRDVISDWLRSQNNLKQCYVIQRDAQPPVIYRDHLPGIDAETGRECRLVTIGLVKRLSEYANGKRPGKIKVTPSEFFDPRTSEPIVWYVDRGGTIEIFDLLGYHPETGEELLAVTPEIVDRWKAQQAQAARRPPRRVDPEKHDFFDPKTGRPTIWYSPGESGALEFFDGPGFHPRTGKALTEITQEFANERLRDIQKRREDAERERQKREADAERERQKREADAERERQKREADAERERQKREAEQQEQQRQQFVRMCDELAANPNDQNRRRTSLGISYDELKTHVTEAIQVCEVAAQQTNDLTSQYQLARAVELVDPPRGQSMQDRLVKKGYPAAFDNAGSLLLHERGCRQHCVNEAVKLFKRGAALGDPDSMMSWADQINNGQATGDVIALYQRAAKLGHPRAIRALEALAQQRMPSGPIFRFPF